MSGYVDFHTHTNRSDGKYPASTLVKMAKSADIKVLAITDHNILAPDLEMLSREVGGGIRLIRGCEVSCNHQLSTGKQVEVHVVVLNYDKDAPRLSQIVAQNNLIDRRAYVTLILDKLRKCGVNIGSYDTLRKKYPETTHIRRMTIAAEMVKCGYVKTVDEAFDRYIGERGSQLAYVKNPTEYVSMERAVNASLADHGIPCLAHLFTYHALNEEERHELVRTFKQLSGDSGAIEVEYARYTSAQRTELRFYADKYGLVPSAASDFHGQGESETLKNFFPMQIYEGLRNCYMNSFSKETMQNNQEHPIYQR